ncbi:MAG: hypothetical protein RLZZ528_705 [Pseudomonadota bacterium]|jgi:hypothetical protein
MTLRSGLLLSVAVATPAMAAPPADPEALGQAWCAAVLAFDEAAAEALMSDSLRDAVARARSADAAFRQEHPDDKPPLGDGLALAAFPDTPATCRVTPAAEGIEIRYVFPDTPDADWIDRLLTAPTAEGLAVVDVLFAPDYRGSLALWLDGVAMAADAR